MELSSPVRLPAPACRQAEAVKMEEFGEVRIVRLENTETDALTVIGIDERGERYKLLPAKDANLTVMAWPGNWGTDEMRIREGVIHLFALAGRERLDKIKIELFVGPAVNYSKSGAIVDESGAALWTKAD